MTTLRQFLEEHGVDAAAIDAAEAEGPQALQVLALDCMLLGGVPRYDSEEVAGKVGIDLAIARRLWRALGFPDVPDGQIAFTDADVEALRIGARLLEMGLTDEKVVIQMTRVVGSSMARIAEAQMDALRRGIQGALVEAGLDDDELAVTTLTLIEHLAPQFATLLPYVHRRHLVDAAQRFSVIDVADRNESNLVVTVGFADLVGFTALSQEMDEHELADVVDRFETLAYDTVGALGGRIVKMIGDEVLFVSDDPVAAGRIALALSQAYADDETLSDVRVGLAYGSVVTHEGDIFGPAVNLASRIVNIAYPGSVVVSDQVRELLADDESFEWKPIRPRRLKGIGWEPLWVLAPQGEGSILATEVARRVRAHRTPRSHRD